jgi:hypothetical protein
LNMTGRSAEALLRRRMQRPRPEEELERAARLKRENLARLEAFRESGCKVEVRPHVPRPTVKPIESLLPE